VSMCLTLDVESTEITAFDLAEPVDVLSKVSPDFLEKVSATQWKERKDVLDELYAAANVPKIKDDNFNDIVMGLAKCMKDANVMVVISAAQCIKALADGLKAAFSRYKGTLLQPILERLKERKQNVVDALASALDGIFFSVNICVP
jgi:hypothetical protein